MQPIAGLSEIAARYEVILCDVWGVIHNGRQSFPEPCAALSRFGAENGPVVLITNAPRPSPSVMAQIDRLGVPRSAWSEIVTSGDATRALLSACAPGPVWKIGTPYEDSLYEGLALDFAEADEAALISVTGPYDDETETPEDYRARFQAPVERGLPMVCANPDIVVQRGDKLIYCGGALARLYAEMGGQVLMAGKPYAAIYDLALARAAEKLGRPLDRSRVLCIGDGLPTDVKGANAQGLDVLFVAAGIHGAETIDEGGLKVAATERLLAQAELSATWAIPDLVW
jgi:HAD superfamily hydrolase (TIGR01459 family)